MTPVQMTYRRTGGLLALVGVAAVAIVGLVLAATLAIALVVVGIAGAAVLLLARAFGWRPWGRRGSTAPREIRDSFDGQTIEGTVVTSAPRDPARDRR